MIKLKKRVKVSSHKLVLCLILSSLFFTLQTHKTYAASGAGSITVSPAEVLLEVAQKQTQQTKEITLTNNYDAPITIGLELRSIDETSGLFVPAAPISDEVGKAIKLSETDFEIQPHTNKVLQITGSNTASLSPGGHYATLVITQRSSDSQQLALRSALSVNLFFVKADGAKVSVKLDQLKAKSWLFHIASAANVTFSNDGNVRATPHGVIYVTNRHGDLISHGITNSGSQPLLPTKSLTNSVKLTRIQRVWYPQKLYFNITYRANDYDSTTKTTSFWYIPPFYILLVLLPIIALYVFIKKRRKSTPKKHTKHVKKGNDGMPKILKIAIRFHDDKTIKIKVNKTSK